MKYTDEECREVVKSLRPVATHSDGLATIKDRQVIYSWKQAQQLVQMLDALEERLAPEPKSLRLRAFEVALKACEAKSNWDAGLYAGIDYVIAELSQSQQLSPFGDREYGYIQWAFKIPKIEAKRFMDWLESIRPERIARASEMSVRNGCAVSITEVEF